MYKKKIIIVSFLVFSCFLKINAQESHGGTPLMFNAEQNNLQNIQRQPSSVEIQRPIQGVISVITPPSIVMPPHDVVYIEKREYPSIDNNREKSIADSVAALNGFDRGKYYAKSIDVNIDFKAEATMVLMGDTGKLYLLELISPTANALQIYFDVFKIPQGARMFILV